MRSIVSRCSGAREAALILAAAALLASPGAAARISAQPGQRNQNSGPQTQNLADVEVHTLHVQGSVYMLVGAGGNITLQVGDEGVPLVDTSFEQMSDKVVAAIRRLSDKPIRYIINTHAH